jgi:hypothetical protein
LPPLISVSIKLTKQQIVIVPPDQLITPFQTSVLRAQLVMNAATNAAITKPTVEPSQENKNAMKRNGNNRNDMM